MSDKNFKVKNGLDANGAVTITQPSTSTVPLTILANTLATGSNLLEVKRPDGTVRLSIGNDGAFSAQNLVAYNVRFYSAQTGSSGLIIRGLPSQTADLQQWRDINETVLASVSASGSISAVDLTLSGNLTVNGTTTNLNSTNLIIEDKNIIIADVTTPTDTTADGAGITIKGATDKTFNWVQSTGSFTSSEPLIINTNSTTRPSLIVKAIASQTSAVQEWQNSSGSSVANIDSDGYFRGPLVETRPTNAGLYGIAIAANASQSGDLFQITDASNNAYTGVSSTGKFVTGNTTNNSRFTQLTSAALGQLTVYAPTSSTVGIVIKGAVSQSSNLTEWKNSNGSTIASVLSNGTFQDSSTGFSAFGMFLFDSSNGMVARGTTATKFYYYANDTILEPLAAGYKGLIIRGATSQTANLQEWQRSGGNADLVVTNFGTLISGGGTTIASNPTINAYGAAMKIASGVNTYPMLIIQGAASQSANIQEWQNSAGTKVSTISPLGYLSINKSYTSYPLEVNGSLYAKDATSANLYIQGGNNLIYPSILTGVGGNGWTSVTANYTAAPDGTTTATRYLWSSSGNCFVLSSLTTNIANIFYTASMYVKPNNSTSRFIFSMRQGDSADFANVEFDSSTNTASYSQRTPTSTFSNGTAGSIYVGNGWYRIWVTAKPTTVLSNFGGMFTTTQNNGDVNIWGAQLEKGYYASAYTPTTNAIVSATNNLYVPSGDIYSTSIQSVVSGTATLNTNGDTGGILINTVAAANKGLAIKGAASQTANLTQWQDSGGNILTRVQADGTISWGTGTSALQNSSGRLIVNPSSASAIAVIAKGAASQTANLQEWQNSAGTVLSNIRPDGTIAAPYLDNPAASGSYLQVNAGTSIDIIARVVAQPTFRVRGVSGQTASLQQWQSSSGTVLANVDSSGNITDASNTAWLSPIGGGSNDAVAIQELIDAGKKEIRLGSGQWTFSTRIKVPNGVTIRGTGTSSSSTTGTRVNAVALIASEGTVRDIMFTGAGENAQSELGGGGIAVLGGRVIDCSVTDSRWVLAPTRQPHGYLKNFMSKMQGGYGSVKVAVLGDSLSENTSTTSWYGYLFNSATTATGYYLGSYFGHQIAPSEVDNMAIGGQGAYLLSAQLAMTKETLRTGDYVNQVLDGDRVSTSPFFNRDYNLAILAIGQNGGEDWKAHLEYTVKTIRDKGIDVIILTQNPAASNPTSRAGDEYFYRSMAETYGCLLVDTQAYFRLEVEFGRALGTTADLFGDSIHQSALGHQLYAKAILNALLDYDSTVAVPANKTVVSRSYLPAQADRAAAIAGLNSYYLVKRPDSLRGISGVTYTTATDTSIRNPIYGRGTTTNSVATIASGGYATWGVEHATAAYIIYRENATANTLTVAIQAGGSTLATLTTGVTNGRTSVQKVMLAGGYPANRAIRITNTSGDPVQIYGVVFETHADVAFNRNTDGSYAGVKLNGSWAYSDFLSMASYSGYLTPHTSTTNNSVEFKFYGDGLRFATSYGKNSGIIQVKIDDTTYTAVDTYNNIGEYGVYTHFYGGLQYGLHTATITLTGANASVTGLTSDGARFGLHRISAVRSEWYLTQDQQFAPNSDTSSIVNSVSSIRMGSVGGANIATFYNGTSGYGAGSIASTGTFNINGANMGFPYASSGATLNVNAGASTIVPLTARGVASQTADLQQWQNSSGTMLVGIDAPNSLAGGVGAFLKFTNAGVGGIKWGNNTVLAVGTISGQTNVMYPYDADRTALIVSGLASQSADLQQWRNSAGTVLGKISSDGGMTLGGANGNKFQVDQFGTLSLGSYRSSSPTFLYVNSQLATDIGAVIRGHASQSASLQEWQDSTGTVLGKVDSAGHLNFLSKIIYANQMYVGTGNYLTATMHNTSGGAGEMRLLLRAHSSQTASIQEWQNSAGTALAKIDALGNFTAKSKSFDIVHPTKENMRLRYGSLEGPENGVYIRGTVESNIIELPDYWTGLVHTDSITVSLTSVGSAQNIYVEKIENNKVYIGGELTKAFFTVYGERKDIDKLTVEY